MSTTLSEITASPYLGEWGPWRLGVDTYVLTHDLPSGSNVYEVDLEKCLSPAAVLDWIAQVARKSWATPDVLAGLVVALADVLNPQATLCGFGESSRLTKAQVRQRAHEVATARPDLVAPDLSEWGHRPPHQGRPARDESNGETRQSAVPRLDAYRDGDCFVVWCEHEQRWHTHGALDGHRVAHCSCAESPFKSAGYVLVEVGPLTAQVRQQHRPTRRRGCPTCAARRAAGR